MWILVWNLARRQVDVVDEEYSEEPMWNSILEELREEEQVEEPGLVWFKAESGCEHKCVFVVSDEPAAWFLFKTIVPGASEDERPRLGLFVFASEQEMASNQPAPGVEPEDRVAFWKGLSPGDRLRGRLSESVLLAKGGN